MDYPLVLEVFGAQRQFVIHLTPNGRQEIHVCDPEEPPTPFPVIMRVVADRGCDNAHDHGEVGGPSVTQA
jgi:hypothetical protein